MLFCSIGCDIALRMMHTTKTRKKSQQIMDYGYAGSEWENICIRFIWITNKQQILALGCI